MATIEIFDYYLLDVLFFFKQASAAIAYHASTIFSKLDVIIIFLFVPQMVAFFLLGLEGMIIDVIYWVNNLGPQIISVEEFEGWKRLPQKRIGVMVACWHEEDVLEAMVTGNLAHVEYDNYEFFLGVYPNDSGTLGIAQRLETANPRVHCIVNSKEGPTCKGQMINEIVKNIMRINEESDAPFDVVMYHDSEDAIHPQSLYVVNKFLGEYDFVQIPVFSFNLPWKLLTGATYMDEFAESHLKELVVRGFCKGAIPSAGVGTAFTKKFLTEFLPHNDGTLFNPKSLTEDYELGIRCHRIGIKQILANICIVDGKNKNFVSTREFFPQDYKAAVRQKSRWNLGIMYQGFINLGWGNNIRENYFLYRDRIGLLSTPLSFFSGILFLYAIVRYTMGVNFIQMAVERNLVPENISALFKIVLLSNFLFMLNRLLHRAFFTYSLYGIKHALLSPVRLIYGNIINFFALSKATNQFFTSKWTGKAPKWLKTSHVAPIMTPTTSVEMNKKEVTA